MEGFTASRYKQLVLNNRPKVDMASVDNALLGGLENFTFFQNLRPVKEDLEKEINIYLENYKDAFNKIVAKIETHEPCENGYNSYVILSIVQNPSNYLKEQGKKMAKETKKLNKYNKNKQ